MGSRECCDGHRRFARDGKPGRLFGAASSRSLGGIAIIVKSLQATSRLQERGTGSIASLIDCAQRPAMQ